MIAPTPMQVGDLAETAIVSATTSGPTSISQPTVFGLGVNGVIFASRAF